MACTCHPETGGLRGMKTGRLGGDRQRLKDIERQRYTEKQRQTDRWTHKLKDTESQRYTERQMDTQRQTVR